MTTTNDNNTTTQQPEDKLDELNFIYYAATHYVVCDSNDLCDFYKDVGRFRYLKSLLEKYKRQKAARERLVINHLTVIFNAFGVDAANKMLVFKIRDELWTYLKPFIIHMGYVDIDYLPHITGDECITNKLKDKQYQDIGEDII